MRKAFDAAPFGVWVRDRSDHVVMQNRQVQVYWCNQVGARTGDGGAPREVVAAWKEANRRALRGQTVREEVQYAAREQPRWFYNIVTPLRIGRRIEGILGFLIDITDRKQAERALQASEAVLEKRVEDRTVRLRESEARFRGLFEAMAEGVIVTAPDGRIVQANVAAERILGLRRADIESRNYVAPEWHVVRPDGAPMPPEEMAGPRAAAEGRPVKDVVMGVKRGDGAMVWLNVSAAPLKGADGKVEGVVGTFTDITDRRRAEHQARARAVQLAQLASELTVSEYRERYRLAELLHDHLQQLIVGARMQAHYLGTGAGKVDPKAVDTLLHTLDEALNSARSITTDLVPAVPLRRDLPMALEWLGKDMMQRHKLSVSLHVDRVPSTMSEATGVLLYSAARELLLNVVKHARTRKADLCLRRRHGWVELEVSDRGRGFDVAAVQANGDHRRFGLFSISERADLLGGSLVLGRAGHRGTRATLTLPLGTESRKPRRTR